MTAIAQQAPMAGDDRFANRLASCLRRDFALHGAIVIYAAAVSVLLTLTGAQSAMAFTTYFVIWPSAFLVIFPAVYLLLAVLTVVHRVEQRRRLAIRSLITPQRAAQFISGLALLVSLMLFQGGFTSVKNALPIWAGGFPHDVAQADLDRLLHFGRDPWLYLKPIIAHPWLLAFVEWNYNQLWFLFCYSSLFYVVVAKECAAIRSRYLVTYMLAWIIIGNLAAGVFLSAGPAFYGVVTGDVARFAPQLTLLAQSGDGMHAAWRVHAYLWNLHANGEAGVGSGISAFPSMHVALVTLNALFIAEHSSRWALVAFGYVAVILASSVALAWHYAIDGYASILVTVAIYLATKAIGARFTAS